MIRDGEMGSICCKSCRRTINAYMPAVAGCGGAAGSQFKGAGLRRRFDQEGHGPAG